MKMPNPLADQISAGLFGRKYWKSIEERERSPEFLAALEREFPMGAAEMSDGIGRRTFLQLLGASLAASGLSGCPRAPPEKILPYNRQPLNLTPGNPLHFATALPLGGSATGMLVTSWEGRPTKVEGNPSHPLSLGATGLFEQASILQLYDPQRARQIKRGGVPRAWKAFLADLIRRGTMLAHTRGSGLRFLLEPSGSPTQQDLRSRILRRFPEARFYSYEPLANDHLHQGARIAYGRPLQPRFHFDKADVVVSLDADFLQPIGPHLRDIRAFSDRRLPGPRMNRLYQVESCLSVTGTMADHRLRTRPSETMEIGLALLRELSQTHHLGALAPLSGGPPSALKPEQANWVQVLARDLMVHRGASLVLVGPRQPPLLHALAFAINEALGNVGQGLELAPLNTLDATTGVSSLSALVDEIKGGTVDTLLITANNPVYNSPVDLAFGDRLDSVPNSIYLGAYEDETAARATWMIPAAHPLETWGDTRAADGTVSIIQPLIAPLFNGVTELDLLAASIGERDKSSYEILKESWRARTPGADFEQRWESWLAAGTVPGMASEAARATLQPEAIAAAVRSRPTAPLEPGGRLEINYLGDYKVYDGRFANNAWLQELPDPITKLTWDNAALLSPSTAGKLGLNTGDRVQLSYRGRGLNAPVFILPGHADETVSLSFGYGRSGAEGIARQVGVNAYLLRHSDAPWFDRGARLEKVKGAHQLAVTHAHWSMLNRPLAMETTLREFDQNPDALESLRGPVETLYKEVSYDNQPYKWAMAVDLARCNGCSACVIACQAENNIPVVGKENVLKSREMHWLRLDRYFSGSLEDPGVITQPVACVHCEKAPCEYVCPVNATVHSDEGLNEMVYNRCVGTRYCSNNCPYKVRRFNFLHYTDGKQPTEKMGMNPDVTVRARGVMEKCSYCVQRIERTRIDARIERRTIRESELQTACQQACPARALTFGSLNDLQSAVSRLHQDHRRYDLLHELGTQPRTAYLARIKNVNPELP
jgi:molybdopterin-containing oxidoreductase family iron-sulfur binding subunit